MSPGLVGQPTRKPLGSNRRAGDHASQHGEWTGCVMIPASSSSCGTLMNVPCKDVIVRELYHRCTHGPQPYELCALLPEALVWGSWYGDGVLYSVPLLDLCVTVIYRDLKKTKHTNDNFPFSVSPLHAPAIYEPKFIVIPSLVC